MQTRFLIRRLFFLCGFILFFLVCQGSPACFAQRSPVIIGPNRYTTVEVYQGEYIVIIAQLGKPITNIYEVWGGSAFLARGYVINGLGFFGFQSPPFWQSGQKLSVYLKPQNAPNKKSNQTVIGEVTYSSQQRPPSLSGGDPSVRFFDTIRATSTSTATIPITAHLPEIPTSGSLNPPPLNVGGPVREGTGIILSKDGLIVTCDHVVRNSTDIQFLYNGTRYRADRVRLRNAEKWVSNDIAFLMAKKLDRSDPDKDFVTAYMSPNIAQLAANQNVAWQGLGYPSIARSNLRSIEGKAQINNTPINGSYNALGSYKALGGAASTAPETIYTVPQSVSVYWNWSGRLDEAEIGGMSGGPLMSPNGYVFGMLHRTSIQPRPNSDYIPSSKIAEAFPDLPFFVNATNRPILNVSNWKDAEKEDKAWPDILDGLVALSQGRVREAPNYFASALTTATTTVARRASLDALERLGPNGATTAAEIVQDELKTRTKMPADLVGNLLTISARYNALPRATLAKALAWRAPGDQQIPRAALTALSDLDDLSLITDKEYRAAILLEESREFAPQATYTLGRLLYDDTDTPQEGTVNSSNTDWQQTVRAIIDESLQGDDFDLRNAAARAIRDSKSRPAVTAIAERLTSGNDNKAKWHLAESLGLIGGNEGVAALGQLLHDSTDKDVRNSAAEALSRIGTPEAAVELKKVLATQDSYSAAHALAMMGGAAAISALKERFLSTPPDNNPPFRAYLIENLAALQRIRSENALISIVETLAPKQDDALIAGLQKANLPKEAYPRLRKIWADHSYPLF